MGNALALCERDKSVIDKNFELYVLNQHCACPLLTIWPGTTRVKFLDFFPQPLTKIIIGYWHPQDDDCYICDTYLLNLKTKLDRLLDDGPIKFKCASHLHSEDVSDIVIDRNGKNLDLQFDWRNFRVENVSLEVFINFLLHNYDFSHGRDYCIKHTCEIPSTDVFSHRLLARRQLLKYLFKK